MVEVYQPTGEEADKIAEIRDAIREAIPAHSKNLIVAHGTVAFLAALIVSVDTNPQLALESAEELSALLVMNVKQLLGMGSVEH